MKPILFLMLAWLGTSTVALAMQQYTAHGGPVRGLAVSADGKWLVSASFDYSAVLWSTDGMVEKRRLLGHEAAVNAAAFSPDGQFLVTAGDDSSLRVWRMDELLDQAQPPSPQVLPGHKAKIVHLAFSSNGRLLASSSWDHSIGVWSVPDFSNLAYLRAHQSPVNAAVFSADASRLYSAGADGHIRLWDMATYRYLKSIVENGWGINVLAIDTRHELLAYGTSNGMVRSHSLTGKRAPIDFLAEGAPVLALTLDPASGRLACGTAEGRMLIARADSGMIDHDFHAAKGPVFAALFVPAQEAVVFAGLDDFVTRLPLQPEMADIDVDGTAERRFHPQKPLSNGARQFARKCSICHSLNNDDQRRAGPSLHGVFGRKAGSVEGYPYSTALATSDLVWSEDTIDALFRDGPEKVTPGSKMPLQRIGNEQNRQDLIHYLKATAKIQ